MTPQHSSSLSRRLLTGAKAGGCIAGLALAVGLLGAIYARYRGINVSFEFEREDARQAAAYIAGFVVSGTMVSALWPSLRRKRSRQAVFVLAGVIVASAVVVGMKGFAWTPFDWVIVFALGSIFGLAFAAGFRAR
jgi:hypothetical protein